MEIAEGTGDDCSLQPSRRQENGGHVVGGRGGRAAAVVVAEVEKCPTKPCMSRQERRKVGRALKSSSRAETLPGQLPALVPTRTCALSGKMPQAASHLYKFFYVCPS